MVCFFCINIICRIDISSGRVQGAKRLGICVARLVGGRRFKGAKRRGGRLVMAKKANHQKGGIFGCCFAFWSTLYIMKLNVGRGFINSRFLEPLRLITCT